MNPDGDTWTFSSDQWTEVHPATAPPARWGAEMVYDASDGYLLMFGGRDDSQYFNDTWAYDAGGWHQIVTATAPSPRTFFGLAYDALDGYVVLFGGALGNLPAGAGPPYYSYDDTWTYHAGVWTNITSTAGLSPSARTTSMTFDARDGYVLLQGGGVAGLCQLLYKDTWKFMGGKWSELNPTEAPLPGGGTLQFDTSTNATLFYQGTGPGTLAENSCSTFGSQVWAFSSGEWTLAVANTSSAPVGRGGPAWVDDPTDRSVLLFGGTGQAVYSYYADTWVLTTTPAPTSLSNQIGALIASPLFIAGSVGVLLAVAAVAWVWASRATHTNPPPWRPPNPPSPPK